MGIRYWAGFRWSGWWVALLFLSATQVHATVDEIDLDPAPPSEPGPVSVLGDDETSVEESAPAARSDAFEF